MSTPVERAPAAHVSVAAAPVTEDAPRRGAAPTPPPPRMRPRVRPEIWTLVGILIVAALARYTGLTQGFPRDFHWDERIYFHEALYALANGLRREQTVSANLPYLLL